MNPATAIERLLRRDRAIVLGAVATVTVLAAVYTVTGAGMGMSALEMTRLPGAPRDTMQMPSAREWTASYALLMFAMWWIMMIAMMTPSAAPTLLLFAAIKRRLSSAPVALAHVWAFLSGYLAAWGAFSLLAVCVHWFAQRQGLLQPGMMALKDQVLVALLFLAAGIYQVAPLKEACLRHCRSPAEFLSAHNRPRPGGAFLTGLHHGTYCLGCCWVLMLLLFAGGVMNLFWIVGLAAIVAVEKSLRIGPAASRLLGAGLAMAGGLLLLVHMS